MHALTWATLSAKFFCLMVQFFMLTTRVTSKYYNDINICNSRIKKSTEVMRVIIGDYGRNRVLSRWTQVEETLKYCLPPHSKFFFFFNTEDKYIYEHFYNGGSSLNFLQRFHFTLTSCKSALYTFWTGTRHFSLPACTSFQTTEIKNEYKRPILINQIYAFLSENGCKKFWKIGKARNYRYIF